MRNKIKLGFIGYGKSTHRYHLPFIDHTNKFEVVGAFSRTNKTFEMEYKPIAKNIKRFQSCNDLLNSDIELVIVTTPSELHYSYAEMAILAGKNVVVEKPFCEQAFQVRELFSLAKEHNVKVIPYQNRRFDSDYLTFKNVMENYDMGNILEIESNHTPYSVKNPAQRGSKYSGAIYGYAVHFLDQIISYFGKPDKVIYDLCNQKNYNFGDGCKMNENIPDDYYDIKLIYDNLRVRVRFSQLIVKEPPRWIINGTKATFEKFMIDQQERDLKKGIFLDSKNFGQDEEKGQGTIYYKDGTSEKVNTIYGGYNLFYEEVCKCLTGEIDYVVSEEEIFTTINILETMANNGTYQPLNK